MHMPAKKRRKRGRPIGSGKIKHPEVLRRYWREQKRKYLAKKRAKSKGGSKKKRN